MTDQTEASELEALLQETEEDNETVKKLRKLLKREAAGHKAALAEVASNHQDRTAKRATAVADAVDGKGIPQAAVDALLAQVENMEEDEYASVLEQLTGVATKKVEDSEESKDEKTADAGALPVVNVADLGDAVAAAADGTTEVNPLDEIRGAKNREELAIAAKKHLAPHGLA